MSRLSSGDRRLALVAIAITAANRLALSLLPFRWIRHWAERSARPRLGGVLRFLLGQSWEGITPDRIAWAAKLGSRYVPAASCLTQALTVQFLLNEAGIESALHIGVTVSEAEGVRKGEFGAHAWVEHEGAVLIGGAEQSARYARILTLRPR